MEKQLKPAIRFKGFTDPWEQRKLGELVQFSKGAGYSKGDLKESGTPIILYGRLYTKYETVIADVDTFADAKNGSVYSRGGEVIVPASGETAEDISIASVVEKQGILLGGDLNIITPPADLDSAFLAISISNGKPHEDMSKMAQGKSVVHLHNTDLEKIDMTYPSHEEQTQISDLFRRIDNLITLHQRKYDKLQVIKKAMLEKMFPQNGSNVPEIRFRGFTDPWELRKFSDLAETRRGLTYNPSSISDSGIRVLRSSNIAEDQFIYGEDDVFVEPDAVNIPKVTQGDILITSANGSTRLIGKHAIIRDIPNNSAVHGGFMLLAVARNPEFVNALMSAPWYTKFISLYVAGGNGAIGNLNKSDLDDQDVYVPENTEQMVIGQYFSQLDHLITLHQRELEKLQKIKKAMLEKMFV